jgi:hypothetical protein
MSAGLGARFPIGDAAAGARLLWNLPAFLRVPVRVERARALLEERLAHREANFLALVRTLVYQHARSPYLGLLKLAGCEYGDLERLVQREGIEGTLQVLLERGVYLTVDEFKGRRPAVRGGATLPINLEDLRNPTSADHLLFHTSGSRGAPSPVPIDLADLRDNAVNTRLVLEARGGARWHVAHWGVPGSAAMARILEFSVCGAPAIRWYSQVDPSAPGVHPRYRWSVRAMRLASRLAGVPLPLPVHVSHAAPLPIAEWLAAVLRAGRTPLLHTFPSSAVRLCRAAMEAGVDVRGAQFSLGSEPTTAARLAVIAQAGAVAVPHYATHECYFLAYGCLAPAAPDDLHFLHDRLALIQPGARSSTALPPRALLITSLRPTAPLILLNVSLGDQAALGPRRCGCPLERLGWTTHLHTVRSYEKLTAGGMTFLDTDVIRVLEEVLPARFGGGATDYQLVEEEGEHGQPRLSLLVHPALGELDSAAVAETFLSAIGSRSGAAQVMALQWRQAGVLRVERRPPRATSSGKIQHLHVEGRAGS